MSRVFKVKEAAEYLAAHVETIRRMARRGEIPSFKVGKDWRFRETELDRWAETHHLRQRSAHILAVDDEENFLNSLRRMLHNAPYRISTVTDGMQALELIQRDPPDVVLLDLKMPEMSGPKTLREIRKIDEKLPVIIITGYPNSELMNEALQHSPFLMLPKPVETKQVTDAVEMALNGSKSKRVFSERAYR